eukprot:1026302-Pyramimonas_sp.AAC.1
MTGHTGPECTFAHRGAKPPQMASSQGQRRRRHTASQANRPTGPECAPVHRRSDTGGSVLDRGRSARLS